MAVLLDRSPTRPKTEDLHGDDEGGAVDPSQGRQQENTSGLKRVLVLMAPARLDELKEALAEVGVFGMTVMEAKVFDRTKPRREVFRGTSYVVDFTLKVELFIVIGDAAVPRILTVLEELLGKGARHDGSVLVSDVVDAVRIRTGERGQEAVDCPAGRSARTRRVS
jgi:nitrogen regulatory protein P-II 1